MCQFFASCCSDTNTQRLTARDVSLKQNTKCVPVGVFALSDCVHYCAESDHTSYTSYSTNSQNEPRICLVSRHDCLIIQ